MNLPRQMNSIGRCAAPPATGAGAAQVSPAQVLVGNPAWVDANLPNPQGTCYIDTPCAGGRSRANVSRHSCCHQMMPIYGINGTSWRGNGSRICSPCAVRVGDTLVRMKKADGDQ